MVIKSIEITNVKGIGSKIFNLDLAPNKPNILVAPNGFGKSSFAIAFDSLRSSKIELDDKNYFNKINDNRPSLSLTLSTGVTLTADDNQNTITDNFDVFVINNQTEPKSVVQTIPGRPAFAKTSLDITTTVLIQTIPARIDFNYNSATIKVAFGANGNKLLKNISNIFSCGKLFHRLENEIDFSRFELRNYRSTFDSVLSQINLQTGTCNELKSWIVTYVLPSFQGLDEFAKLSSLIRTFGFEEIVDEVDAYLTAWQIITVRNRLGVNFKKACKYLYYLDEKEDFTKTITSFNPVIDRFDIKPRVEGNSMNFSIFDLLLKSHYL